MRSLLPLLLTLSTLVVATGCDDGGDPLPMELRFAGRVADDSSASFEFDIVETGAIRVELVALSLAEGEVAEGTTLGVGVALGTPDGAECQIAASPLGFALGSDNLFHLERDRYCLFVTGQGVLPADVAVDFEVLISTLES